MPGKFEFSVVTRECLDISTNTTYWESFDDQRNKYVANREEEAIGLALQAMTKRAVSLRHTARL